jgi:hypothetical protein
MNLPTAIQLAMKTIFTALFSLCLGAALLPLPAHAATNEWTNLLDPKLSQFDVWLGVPEPSVTGLPPGTPTSSDRHTGKPLGLNNDPKHVFSVIEEAGQPVLKITGEIYGGAVTRQEYSNYHFTCQVKFVEKKWPPREKSPLNSGVLYHSTGPHGAAANAWMRSFEFQGMEARRGDLYRVAGTDADIRTTPRDPANPKTKVKWDPTQPANNNNPVEHAGDYDGSSGEWTTVDIYALGRQSVHLINGHVVMALDNTRLKDGTPLSAGKIQLQSEGAEVYYRDVRIQPITEFPEEIQKASGLNAPAPAKSK